MNSRGYEKFRKEASQFGSIAEEMELERKLGRVKSKRLEPKIYRILKNKESEIAHREKNRLPAMPENDEYVDVFRVPLLDSRDEYKEKQHAIALMETKLRSKASGLIESILNDDEIEFIRELPQRIRRKKRDKLIGLVKRDLLLWLLDEFNIKQQCPLCILRFPKNHPEYRAIRHVQEHLDAIVAKAVKIFV